MFRFKRNKNRINVIIILAALLLFAGVIMLAKEKDAWQWIEEQWPIRSWVEDSSEAESSVQTEEERFEDTEESSEADEEVETDWEDTYYVPEESTAEESEAEESSVLEESSKPVDDDGAGESVSGEESINNAVTDNWGVEDWN